METTRESKIEREVIKGTSIAGRKRNDGIDYYQTPIRATKELLLREKFEGSILEPASGGGAISRVLEEEGYDVISQDIRTDEGVYGKKGINFLGLDSEREYFNIVTNPPYFIAQEFIEKSLQKTFGKVAMLLKLSFLESVGRYEFFKNTPLKKVYVFCKRVNMYPEGQPIPKNSGTIAYAWYIWEHGYEGDPIIEWIK